jgi:hypothetical protein
MLIGIVHKTIQLGTRISVLFLLMLAASSVAWAQSPPNLLPSQTAGISSGLGATQAQSPAGYPATTIEKISMPQLRYRLIERFSHLFFCDPDHYPVENPVREKTQAMAAFPVIREDEAAFIEIKKHLNLEKTNEFSTDQEVLVYREYKILRGAIRLTPEGDSFRFGIAIRENVRGVRANGAQITGLINGNGEISVLEKTPRDLTCPICLAKGTRIDTPTGQLPIEELKPGMMVWTLDGLNEKVSVPIIAVTRVAVPAGHTMIRLRLNDGRDLQVSPGHPTASGGKVADLKTGAEYDHGVVAVARLEVYEGAETFDLLPAGVTGFYWANGILLASTLMNSFSPP